MCKDTSDIHGRSRQRSSITLVAISGICDCYFFQVEIFLSRALSDRSSFYCMVDCHLLEFEMCRYIQMRVTELDDINKVDDYGLAFIYQVSVVIFHASRNYCSDACCLTVCRYIHTCTGTLLFAPLRFNGHCSPVK